MGRSAGSIALLILLIAPLAGCSAERESIRAWEADVRSELDAAYARFREAYRLADAEMVAALYTDSALYLPPGADIIRGRQAVYKTFERFLGPVAARGESGPEIRFEVVDRAMSGDLAYDIGYFVLRGTDRGKFIVIWKRGADGIWRIHADGYSEAPAATDG